jgi:hypothetical protein
MKIIAALLAAATFASAQQIPLPKPLPQNYRTTLENDDLLVMHVHYGPREFIPMHDHSAYPTVYIYLNDSGPIKIKHDGPDEEIAIRPPTHLGAFRVAPGVAERHSVTSQSDTASDFLRVELKRIPPDAIKDVFRGELPAQPPTGTHTEFQNDALRIARTVCEATEPCSVPKVSARSLLIVMRDQTVASERGPVILSAGNVHWLPANTSLGWEFKPGAQILQVVLLYP